MEVKNSGFLMSENFSVVIELFYIFRNRSLLPLKGLVGKALGAVSQDIQVCLNFFHPVGINFNCAIPSLNRGTLI